MKKILFALIAVMALIGTVFAEPRVAVSQSPIVNCYADGCSVVVNLKNTGSDMPSFWLIELQPRPEGQLPLSISVQQTCDAAYPQNVHREFYLAGGESEAVSLSTKLTPGDYDLYLLPRDRCWNWFQNNNIVPIYKSLLSSETWGSYYKIGTFHVGGTATTQATTTTHSHITTTTQGNGGNQNDNTTAFLVIGVGLVGVYLITKK